MSRHIQDVASIQFQVNTRQANGAMKAMQEAAIELGRYINDVNRKIANLGEGAVPENPAFVELDNQLKGYMKRLNDVQKAQKDFMRGAKAADQLTKAAAEGNIESLSFRAIKAGQNGLRKRQEGLSPGDAKDMKEWRIIENVIKEAQRIVNEASADVQHTIQTIREGGKVSEQNMRQTINTLRDLKASVDETDADFVHWGKDLDFMEAKFKEFGENQRRLKGELVDANDARREMEKLSEQGAKTAEQERQAAEQQIDTYKKEGEQLAQNRAEIKQNIADTQKEMEQQHQLIESKHEELAKAEELFNTEQAGRREALDGLQQQAEKERKLSNEKADQAELQRQAAEVQKQQTEQLGQKVTEITEKLAAIQAQKAAPNPTMEAVKTSAQEANAELDDIERKLKNIAKLRGESQKVVDDFEAKYGKTEDERFEKQEALRKEAIRKDEVARKQSVEKVEQKWQEYWRKQEEQAKQFAATLGKSLKELDLSEISKHLEGPQAAKAKAAYRVVASNDYELGEALFGEGELNQDKEWAKRYEGDDSPTAKIIESMQRKYREYIKEVREAENVDTEAAAVRKKLTEENTKYLTALGELESYQQVENKLLEQKTGLQQQQTQAQHQQNEETEEEIKLKQDLKTFQDLYNESYDAQNTKLREANKLQGEAIEQQKKAEQAEGEAAKAQGEMIDKQAEFNAQQQEGLKEVGEMSKGYTDLTAKMTTFGAQLQANDEATQKNAENMAAAEQRKQQNASLSIKRMEEMLALLKQEYYQEGVNAEEHEKHAKTIQQLEKVIAEERGKATLQMMTERMDDLGKLSNSAFEETKRFWQTMEAGAEKGSAKLTEAQENMKLLIAEERTRNEESAGKVIGDMGSFSDKEIADAVKMFEQMRDSLARTDDKWNEFNEQAQKGTEYLEQMKKQDALEKMEERMSHLSTLSDAARAETKKFFEALQAGAEKGSEDLKKAEAALKQIKELEKDRNQEKADILLNGTLGNYSENEIREAIEAAKEFRSELKSGDTTAKEYAEAIARAEVHLEKFGIKTARAAKQQEESDRMMSKQLSRMREDMLMGNALPSTELLKAQHQYWKKLIDDPKNADKNLKEYRDHLAEVKQMEKEMVEISGETAFSWFNQGSDKDSYDTKIKEMADNLKAYRATLLHDTDSEKISKIDAILERVSGKAKKATQDLMDYNQAKDLATQAQENVYLNKDKADFIASPEEIQAATKSLEKLRDERIKDLKVKRESGAATEEEEAEIADLTSKLKALKFEQDNFNMSQEKMQMLMEKPTSAVNIDELRAAIKRADGELKRMEGSLGDNSEEYKAFAEQVKQAKGVLKEMEGQAKATTSTWDKAWSRLKTYVGMYMGFNMAWQRITGTADDLMELSDKLGEVRKTTGFTADEVGRLSDNLKKMDTRTTINGLLDLSVAAGQLGLKTEQDVQGFVEAANKLMVALPEMGQEGATQMLKVALATGEIDKIQKQMDEGLVEGSSATAVAMEKVASTIDRLRATSAATAPAITDFVKRVGAVGAQSGISIDQIAALGSTVDALGLRVEMSATALSRMIPAIRNNAFDVAKAIGVTPESLRNLFDTGRGMEAILMIFQHIKDAGMDEDSIEQMLGMGNMKEIMKELNQQGARAGIVFAGLSQNVDELRKHLVTASEAYEENIAIQSEYEKMNETTMAKWIRLKNQLEEMFVGDAAQRILGVIIDGLRWIVDFISGNLNPVLNATSALIKAIGVAWAVAYSGMGAGLKAVWMWVTNLDVNIKKLTASLKAFYAANKANLWMAAAAAVFYLGLKIRDALQEVNGLAKALVDAESNLATMTRAVGELFSKYTQVTEKQRELERSTNKLKEREAALKEETEALRKSLGDGAEKSDKFKKKQDELAKAHEEVAKAEGEAAKETNKRSALISEINSKYGTYLGYMLSEASTAETVASAHDLIIAALKEEMYWKEKNQAFETVKKQHEETLKDYREAALNEMNSIDVMRQQNIMSEWQAQLTKVKYDAKAGGFVIPGYSEAFSTLNEAVEGMKEVFNSVLQNKGGYYMVHPDDQQARLENWWGQSGFGGFTDRGFKDWTRESLKVIQEAATLQSMSGSAAEAAHESAVQKAVENTNALIKQAQEAGVGGKINNNKKLAEAIVGIQKNLSKYGELSSTFKQFGDNSLESVGKELLKYQTEAQRKAIMDEVQRVAANGVTPVKPPKPTKEVWGTTPSAESTDYGTWDVDELVARRNQMDKFKNILKPDTDVKAVLAEDKALMKALQNGLSSDWKSVMNWYNQERLKIQEELKSERFSTNQGHWRDEKNGRGRRNRFRESDYALAELDRYYSKRKEELEKARIEENMSEELFNRQAELLEQEHLERRSKLRETFTAGETKEEQEMVKKFREWWENLEKQGLLDDVPWKTVESEWSKALASDIGRNNLKAQQDLTQLQQITVKHLNKIADIIAKERPYDGIVDNLRKNLTEMDILLGDIQKQGPTANPATLVQEQNKRLQFLLGEAENAYSTTVEDVLRRMADAGMTAWADEIGKSDAMKNALMAQLQKAYDEIQNAIKKEASDIKKQIDIWWNDLVPGQDQSRKGVFEKALSQLGLQEDQVKRANQLIGAGAASERVADKLAIKQMQLRLQMQQVYYDKMRQMWADRIAALRAQGKEIDAQHAEISKQLSLAEEQKKLDEQRVAIANQLEESQNRLYTTLREWADLLSSSVQSMMEASHAGDAEYYNELAKLNLTGKGGPGAGTYIVIDNEGTENAEAHYEYLDERAALERQREIERQNAEAEAWKKVMDDFNNKMSDQITDWINAMVQNQSIDANTQAVMANTMAIYASMGKAAAETKAETPAESGSYMSSDKEAASMTGMGGEISDADAALEREMFYAQQKMNIDNMVTENKLENDKKEKTSTQSKNKSEVQSTQSTFAKMSLAANMYGAAYQAMSNDNLNATQKFQMIALQGIGSMALAGLEVLKSEMIADAASKTPGVLGKLWSQLGWAAAPVFAIFTGLLGGLMGLATSKVTKSKAQIAQVTGASSSVGRLSTGMQTYAEGNVNEFSDPASLTPGRSYNVDAADGKTYRAKYTGRNPSTHLTNGPEFHLAGEKGREMIIDAGTTRQITMNENEIWQAIKTLSGGGRITSRRRRGKGVRAFAEGNVDDFETIDNGESAIDNYGFDPVAMKDSIDKNNDLLERALTEGIKGVFDVYGPNGLVASYDKGKKNATRHGERY